MLTITNSYLQDQRHANQTDRYKPIQPAKITEIMESNGLTLTTLSTSKARKTDYANYQRTLARYRGPEISDGIYIDVLYDSRKLGRGVDKLLLGIYRLICTNGMVTGKAFFNYDIRHTGNVTDNLDQGIKTALKMQATLAERIRKMQDITLSKDQYKIIADQTARLLVPETAQDVYNNLLRVNRQEDFTPNLWNVYNTIQENATLGNTVGYKMPLFDELNEVRGYRSYSNRPLKANTKKDVDFNQALFTIVDKFVA